MVCSFHLIILKSYSFYMDYNLELEDWGNNDNQAKYSTFNYMEVGYEVRKIEVYIVTLLFQIFFLLFIIQREFSVSEYVWSKCLSHCH